MRKNIIIFLTFLIFGVFYACYDSSNFAYAFDNPLLCDSYEEIGCPWGSNYNDDVGIRTAKVYCLDCDSSFMCTTAGDWDLYEDCNDCQYCNEENGEYSCVQDESPLYPKNGQFEIALRPVTLDWCSIDGATSYKIKIWKWEKDENYDNVWSGSLEKDLESKESTVCANFLDDKDDVYYKWQIVPCYGSSCDDFGRIEWSFDTAEKQSIEPPSLYSPFGDSFSIPVTFKWEKIDNAESYYVKIALIPNLTDLGNRITVLSGPVASESLTVGVETLTRDGYYVWSVSACLGEDGNACGSNCCFNESGEECSDSSSGMPFKTSREATFNNVELISPKDEDPSVKPSDLFEWESLGATGFVFEVREGEERWDLKDKVLEIKTQSTSTALSILAWGNEKTSDKITFNSEYAWKVTPCWWINGKVSDCGTASIEQSFTTAGGQVTTVISPTSDASSPIPTVFRWEKVPNASSYSFQLLKGNNIVATSTIKWNSYVLDYPFVKPSTTYSWTIQACANEDGSFCEDGWIEESFSVEEFPAPSSKQLEDREVFTYEDNLIWEPVASTRSYEWAIQYDEKADEETNEDCKVGTAVKEGIASNPYILMPAFSKTQQKCLGKYTLWVTACLIENCEHKDQDNSSMTRWEFFYVQPSSSEESGMMPCNRDYDFENTPWNEREVCQLKHVPILIYNIIDFILWKASFIALLVLVVFSGIIAYASAGLPIKVVSIKEVWKNAGKGYLVMFFAWTIISLVLRLLGITDSFLMLPSFL